jgi:hypothetical protein
MWSQKRVGWHDGAVKGQDFIDAQLAKPKKNK